MEGLRANLAPIWSPKGFQNRVQNEKKSMLKNDAFLAPILRGFGRGFGEDFGRFFAPKVHEKSKEMILAKTLKIVILPR